ncbi:MAG: hypothetical protein H6Q00_2341 [Holophagaceae bacterium]|nr:hypothetical protein [Holophagaceae bacterium]
MKNPCGTAPARIYESSETGRVPVYFGSGVNPANSPAQFFVAWGQGVLEEGFLPTFNQDTPEAGFLWFVDEEEAEECYREIKLRWPT